MASASISTLQHVTERKLEKLAAGQRKFETDRNTILAKVVAAPDVRDKLQELLDGFELHNINVPDPDLSLANLGRFVKQAKHDPSVSPALMRGWQTKLEHALDTKASKYEYASLFGKLVTEWVKNPGPAAATQVSASDSDSESISPGERFDKVGRAELYEQRKQWEAHAFNEKHVDQTKVEEYLWDIFGTTQQAKKVKETPLQNLQESMKKVMDFKSELRSVDYSTDQEWVTETHRFDTTNLKACIRGVIKSDLMSAEKRDGLKDLLNQQVVLRELVDVLNMDLDSLDSWEWGSEPVPLHLRRQLNGKYRVYMDEETHQALFLHFAGQIWAVAMKKAFVAFYHSGAWLQAPHRAMTKKARHRREYFDPGSTKRSNTVRNKRRDTYQTDYFMMQLPDKLDSHVDYDIDAQQEDVKSPMATKQGLLRLLTTEILLNTKLYGECTVVQSDFKWFGPSLSHDAIFAVLRFFGVPEKWLRLFRKVLEPRVVFAQDGPNAAVHVRKCGVPMSHVLSDALSEAVLFCLDFAVNKRTGGANIYRFHDDLWFWGQEDTCIRAWNACTGFASVMGLELNEEKTGTALVFDKGSTAHPLSTSPLADSLPQGKIKWGFLVFDPSAGRWLIDRAQVDVHIEELRCQLSACRSVMGWVQAWNSYLDRFFNTNFGQPAVCLGRAHNDMIIETFQHIQQTLFEKNGTANVTDHLRNMLTERFGTDDSVPDAFFYFPPVLGGLGLRNPFVRAFRTRDSSPKEPGDYIVRAIEEDYDDWATLKERWDAGKGRLPTPKYTGPASNNESPDADADEPFLTYEEYTMYREETSEYLQKEYLALMELSREDGVEINRDIYQELSVLDAEDDGYWLWIYKLYGSEIRERFGGSGLQLGEHELLPIGLVDALRSQKVRLEG
ncbi:hypothetical protein M011DRAFT_471438 [Sporormia fimetaria CBS 119925]|uniref:Uncharacterized protein n=1 Tax=Sporormia fimetaria CBS 119925 TaxID=1340428 RepID=A0A6A6UYC6_9PLEO|nr:hypothetical protein M011DRAFT_471438 [Sporormia fimetaria CBS 119925]